MTNIDAGEKLLKEAEIYLQEMENNFKAKEWNITIRKAQEVTELSLKGLLKIMGIEYPKVHDLGKFFVTTLSNRGIMLSEEDSQKLRFISAILAEKRAPAFYFEKEYTREDATEAAKGARWVYNKIQTLKTSITKRD
jgi:HEPN domain-containing protein